MPHLVAAAATAVAEAVFVATADAVGISAAATIANIAFFATEAGIALATSAAVSQLTKPQAASPEAVMTPLNQTRPPWRWGVGRMRLSGPRALWQNVSGWAVESQMLHEGRVDGFEQVYLSDQKVTLKSNGFVQSSGDAYAGDLLGIWLRPGRPTEEPTANLVSVCGDDWTNAHRNDGVAALDMMIKAVRAQDVTRRYPTSGAPEPSVVTRLSRVYDWRDVTQNIANPSTWKWSENAVLCHLTWEWYGRYLRKASVDNVTPNAEQMKIWQRRFLPALDFWTTAADIAGEEITRKDGSVAMRYRVAMMILSTDAPSTIRTAFLKSYDGWMLRRSDGAWVVRAGRYVNPTFEVTDSNLKELTWDVGTDDAQVVNVLTGSFLSPDNDYTTQAIDPWVDDASTTEGEIPDNFDLPQVPDHEQGRMLLKREMFRRRAARTGTLSLDLTGLDIADGAHRWIRVLRLNGPMSMRNVVLEITGEGRVDFSKLSVSFPVRSSGPSIDEWTPSLEGGFKPNETDRTPPVGSLPPTVLDGYAVFQSDTAALLIVKVENTHDDSTIYQVSYLDSSGKSYDGAWQEGDVVTGGLELHAGPVGIGNYTVVVRSDIAGRISEWSNPPLAISATEEDAPYIPPKYSDGTDINDLQPAEPGADVTGGHTSADTAHVSGVASNTVIVRITNAQNDATAAMSTALAGIADLQDQLNAMQDSLGDSLGAIATTLADHNSRITNTANNLTAEISDRQALATQVRGGYTGTDPAALSSGLVYNQRIVSSAADATNASNTAAVAGNLATANSNIAAHGDAINALTIRMTAAEGNIASSASSITSLSSGLSALNGTVAGQGTSIASLTTSVTSLSGTVSSISMNLTAVTSTVGGHTSSITSLFTTTATQTDQLTNLYAKSSVLLSVDTGSGVKVVGWTLNNDGATGNMDIQIDHFALSSGTSGARLEFSDMNLRIYNASGNLIVREGVWTA